MTRAYLPIIIALALFLIGCAIGAVRSALKGGR